MSVLIDNRYRLVRTLGQGGAGTVHLVEDTFLEDRQLALKTLEQADDELGRELIAREFFQLTRLVHPNLVKVFDFGVDPRTKLCYFTMELVEGKDLLTATEGRTPEEVYPLIAQICRVLDYLHEHRTLHNDVKPGNLTVTDEESGRRVHLLDFGLARMRPVKESGSRNKTSSVIQGTVHYLAPEVIAGKAPDSRSDLYALGVVLYEVFTRRHPFQRDGSQRLGDARHLKPKPPSTWASGLPAGLDELVLQLLSAQPRERPRSAHDVLARLNTIAGTTFDAETPETAASYVHGGRFLGREGVLTVADGLMRCIGAPGLLPADEAVPPQFGPEAGSAPPGLLLLLGESGMGKTRVLKEIRVQGQLAGILPLEMPSGLQAQRPYAAIGQVLRQLVLTAADRPDLLDRLLEDYGAGVLRLLPELRPGRILQSLAVLPAAQEEARLHEQISRFLLELAARRPSMILVDDLSKLDERSLELLIYLSRNLWLRRQAGENLPVAILATLQQREGGLRKMPGAPQDKIDQLRGESFCWEFLLEPLTSENVRTLVSTMFGMDQLPKKFADWVVALAGGNPLFVEELIEFLVDEGLIRRQEGRWQVLIDDPTGLEIPKSLSAILAGRLARLGSGALRLLQVLSAFGRPVPEALLLELGDQEPQAGNPELQRLLRRGFVVERRRGDRALYELEQPATGEVLYQKIPEAERRALHLRIARQLEAQLSGGDPAESAGELARHFGLGGDLIGACRPAWVAGDGLRQVYSNKKALEMYQVVFDAFAAFRETAGTRDWNGFPLSLPELVQVYWSGCKANKEVGQYREAMGVAAALLYLGRRAGDEKLQAQATTQIGTLYRLQGNYDRAKACIQRALESFRRLDEVRGMSESLHELGYMDYLTGKYLSSLEFYQQSLGIRKSLGDRAGIAESYNNIGTVHFYMGNYNQSMDYYRRALEIRRAIEDKFGIGKNLNNIGLIYYQLGDLEKARHFLEESLDLKRSMNERAGVANTLSNLGEIHRTLGSYQRAYECESESLALKRQIGDSQGCCISAANLGIVCTRLGRYDEAMEHLSYSLATTRRIGFRMLENEALCNLAETHFETGNSRQALLIAESALRLANESSSRPDQMTANLMLGWLHLELDRPEDAVGHLHLAAQLASDLSSKEKLAAAQVGMGSYLRRAGRLDEALATLEKAQRLARDLKSRFLMARGSLEQGRCHLDRGQLEESAEALKAARAAATKLQCPELEWQISFTTGLVDAAARRYVPAFEQFRRCVEVFRAAASSLAAAPMREAYLQDKRRARVAECVRDLKAELKRLVR